LKKVSVLIIDKIYMVNAELFTFVLRLFARIHGCITPFGGIHIICMGDLLQLPPVSGAQVFHSPTWRLFFPLFLTFSHRHASDIPFLELLHEIRHGRLSLQSRQLLQQKAESFDVAQPHLTTFLVSRRDRARQLSSAILEGIGISTQVLTSTAIDRQEFTLLDLGVAEPAFKARD
jgi:hypothetical protein